MKKIMRAAMALVLILAAGMLYAASIDTARHKVGVEMFQKGLYSQALAEFNEILNNYPYSPVYNNALYYAARCRFGLGQFQQALAHFRGLSERAANTAEQRQAAFGMAECYYRLKDYSSAASLFEQFAQNAPDSPVAPAALYYAGRSREALGAPEQSDALYRRLVRLYPLHQYSLMVKDKLCDGPGRFESGPAVTNVVIITNLAAPAASNAEPRRSPRPFSDQLPRRNDTPLDEKGPGKESGYPMSPDMRVLPEGQSSRIEISRTLDVVDFIADEPLGTNDGAQDNGQGAQTNAMADTNISLPEPGRSIYPGSNQASAPMAEKQPPVWTLTNSVTLTNTVIITNRTETSPAKPVLLTNTVDYNEMIRERTENEARFELSLMKQDAPPAVDPAVAAREREENERREQENQRYRSLVELKARLLELKDKAMENKKKILQEGEK